MQWYDGIFLVFVAKFILIFKILSTWTQGQSVKQETGIKVELEETEARNECYPQTRAFARLLNRLIDITIPSTLGAGYRVPGFSPYLEFLRDNVFMRFKERAYQDSAEKVFFCLLVIRYIDILWFMLYDAEYNGMK